MTSVPHDLASAQWKMIRDASYEVAILPWGATEPHNLHLPFCADVIESEYVAYLSLSKTNNPEYNLRFRVVSGKI